MNYSGYQLAGDTPLSQFPHKSLRHLVRCHVDDVAKIKAYAATLLKERKHTI